MLGSVVGYVIGVHGGRRLLDHPGRLEKSRRKLLAKGDRVFARHNFVASVTMPAFVSGIFRVRFYIFILGALVAGIGWIDVCRAFVLPWRGDREAYRKHRRESGARRGRDSRHRIGYPSRGVEMAHSPASTTGISGPSVPPHTTPRTLTPWPSSPPPGVFPGAEGTDMATAPRQGQPAGAASAPAVARVYPAARARLS